MDRKPRRLREGVHAHDQYFFVVGAIEDANAPAFGQLACAAPKKIVLQFKRARMLETKDLAALRVTPDITWLQTTQCAEPN